jgi:hypothetical protein
LCLVVLSYPQPIRFAGYAQFYGLDAWRPLFHCGLYPIQSHSVGLRRQPAWCERSGTWKHTWSPHPRALPEDFNDNSTYAWFPLQTPKSMKDFLDNLGTADQYSFNRPADAPVTAVARHYNDVRQILGCAQFRPSYSDKAAQVISGEGCVLVWPGRRENRSC